MGVKHEVNQRPLQSGTLAFEHAEAGAGDFDRPFKIEDIQIHTNIPMGFDLEIKFPGFAPFSDLQIIGVVFSNLDLRVGNIRNSATEFWSHHRLF